VVLTSTPSWGPGGLDLSSLLVALLVLWVVLLPVQVLQSGLRAPKCGTPDLKCTSEGPPIEGVVSYYGGLRWRQRGLGANLRWPWARLDVGFDGVAIGPSFRWQPWRCPYWWFRSSDLRAEHGGWALRLVIKEASEMLFEPVQPRVVVILKAMEARGLRTDYAEKPAPWIKLR